MIQLKDKETGRPLGTLNEEQLQFLIDHLEEESHDDRDYYLNATTLEALTRKSTDSELIEMLNRALGDRAEVEIEWARE